ncbi:MAG: cupin domain-containing protein [Ferruginibacter sp.]|nr:cupin domain-containing protein [Ferruginibacter sp.]
MVVDEIDLGHESGQPIAPFKGSKFIVYPNQTSPLDIHDVKECWFIAAGSGIVTCNGATEKAVNPGDVLFFNSQQSHQVFNNGPENLLVFSVWWK